MTYSNNSNIDDFWGNETLTDCYRDSDYFSNYFIPDTLQHRNNEIHTLMSYMRPILKDKQPTNAIIIGDIGTGKTTVIKKLFDSFNKKNEKACCCYVNCQLKTSINTVYLKIYKSISGKEIIENKNNDDIFEDILNELRIKNKHLIVCLDDIDSYFRKTEISKMINQLLRSYETDNKLLISLFIIVNNDRFFSSLDQRAKSIFIHEEVRFKDYTKEQIFDILKERCKWGFCEHVITDEQIRVIANYCSVFSDIRRGLGLLTKLGNMINVDNDCKIRDVHVDIAIKEDMALSY